MDMSNLKASPKTLDPAIGWAVGAAIVKTQVTHQADDNLTLLLVKRAAHETGFANHWEIPGGGVEASDESIDAALRREVFEETGLVVTSVDGRLPDHKFPSRSGRPIVKLTYLVSVEQQDAIKLNPDEHSEYVWAGKQNLLEGRLSLITPEMLEIVKNALEAAARLKRERI